MRPSRFTAKQILAALAQVQEGTPAIEVCRTLGITQTTFYRWRRQHGRSGATGGQDMKTLREENRKLKDIVTKLMLEKA